MIKNISSGMIKAYKNFGIGKNVSQKDIFSYFSVQLGGDGNSLSKSQLKNYINQNSSKLSPQKKRVLKNLLNHWDKITDGKEEITEKDFNKVSKFIFEYMNTDMSEDDKEIKKAENKKSDKKAEKTKISKDEEDKKKNKQEKTTDKSTDYVKKEIPEYTAKDKILEETFQSPIDFKIS